MSICIVAAPIRPASDAERPPSRLLRALRAPPAVALFCQFASSPPSKVLLKRNPSPLVRSFTAGQTRAGQSMALLFHFSISSPVGADLCHRLTALPIAPPWYPNAPDGRLPTSSCQGSSPRPGHPRVARRISARRPFAACEPAEPGLTCEGTGRAKVHSMFYAARWQLSTPRVGIFDNGLGRTAGIERQRHDHERRTIGDRGRNL